MKAFLKQCCCFRARPAWQDHSPFSGWHLTQCSTPQATTGSFKSSCCEDTFDALSLIVENDLSPRPLHLAEELLNFLCGCSPPFEAHCVKHSAESGHVRGSIPLHRVADIGTPDGHLALH